MNDNGEICEIAEANMPAEKPCLPSISSALVVGAILGLGEAFILAFLAGPILTVMGVGSVSLSSIYSLSLGVVRGDCFGTWRSTNQVFFL